LLGGGPRARQAAAPPAPAVPPEHWEQNLAPNPGFELDADGNQAPDGWRLPQGQCAWDAAERADGQHSLRFTNTDPGVYRLATAPVALIPGLRYRFSVAVKGQDIRSEDPSDRGATLCIEWQDAQDKWLGGAYPRGLVGTFAWTRAGGETSVVPPNAARAHVALYMREKTVGTAWFDDVQVEALRGPLLCVTLLEPAYQATLEPPTDQQKVVLEVRLNPREHPIAASGLRLRLALRDPGGEPVACYPLRRVPCTEEPLLVSAAVPELPFGTYQFAVELLGRGGDPLAQDTARFHVVPPVQRKVRVDARGRLLVEGQPFFPLGLYLGPTEDEHLARIAQGGFNTLLCYGYGPATDPRAYLDRAAKHGLKVIYSIKDFYEGSEWYPKREGKTDEDLIRDYVTQLRDHPALLAWYTNDELGPEWMPKLRAAYDLVRTLDPDHPTFQVLCQPDENHLYYGVTDILGVDPYPIPRRPVTMVGEWMDTARAAMRDRKPAWCVPQIFQWGVYHHDAAEREPTADEKRAMIYLALIHRAQGLVCYSYHDLFKDVPAGKQVPQEVFERRWTEVTDALRDIREILPFLLDGEETAADLTSRVRYRVLRLKDKACVIFVNTDPKDMAAALIPLPCGTTARKLRSGLVVPILGGKLSMAILPPLGAAVYVVE
jgi:hypothetical protein